MENENIELNDKDVVIFTASKIKRIINFIIDLLFILILIVIIGILCGLYLLILEMFNIKDPVNIEKLFDNKIINIILNSIVIFLYYIFFEGIFGKSLAKFITKTKVVDKNFLKPRLFQIFIRTIVRLIPFEFLSFIKSDIGLHDNLSKTYVVDLKKINKK